MLHISGADEIVSRRPSPQTCRFPPVKQAMPKASLFRPIPSDSRLSYPCPSPLPHPCLILVRHSPPVPTYCSSGLRRCRWARRCFSPFGILGEGKLVCQVLLCRHQAGGQDDAFVRLT
ncbi:hypothetical protein LY76DRAFT_421787 [Colletotrichum caudatum]|nr:hypothetical protein LY76DRAFT_421787 [Colletotrichum caudatum]